ncbi:substrate-binding domain-containing protein, partial [Klebsiella pneumoniae]
MAVEAAARRHGLHFIPLHAEKFELALRRRNYFEPAMQRLLEFARSKR